LDIQETLFRAINNFTEIVEQLIDSSYSNMQPSDKQLLLTQLYKSSQESLDALNLLRSILVTETQEVFLFGLIEDVAILIVAIIILLIAYIYGGVVANRREIFVNNLLEKESDFYNLKKELTSLQSIIPICSYCHKIRKDDEQTWQDLMKYVREHSTSEFSHGVCPSCADKMDDHDVNV